MGYGQAESSLKLNHGREKWDECPQFRWNKFIGI